MQRQMRASKHRYGDCCIPAAAASHASQCERCVSVLPFPRYSAPLSPLLLVSSLTLSSSSSGHPNTRPMVVTIEVSEEPPALVNGKVHEEAALQALESQLMPDGGGGDNDNNDDDDEEEDQPSAASKRKREPESDATDVDNDFEDDDAFDDVVNDVPATSQSLTATLSSSVTTPVSIKSRRPSRSCKPNSLIFNSDTTTLSPKRRRKVVRESLSPSPDLSHQQSNNTSGDSNSSTTANGRKSAATATISSRSFARESVRKAVSALTGLNRPVKKLGRPRKYPIEGPAESVSPVAVKNGRIPVGRKGRKVGRGKKLTVKKASSASPVGKCTPILTAILSGQSLAQTKTGRPKGRPRVLPSLDEVILNGAKSSPNTTSATRSSPRRCDCEAKYKKILSNLEQSLEVKFAESTHKVS